MDDIVNYGKPKSIRIVCRRCLKENDFQIIVMVDMRDKRIVCSHCYKTFMVSIHWQPTVITQKENYEDV